jgi:hypothetical protein
VAAFYVTCISTFDCISAARVLWFYRTYGTPCLNSVDLNLIKFLILLLLFSLSFFVLIFTLSYYHLKEEAQDRTMWRNSFGRGFGPVVSQTEYLLNENVLGIPCRMIAT